MQLSSPAEETWNNEIQRNAINLLSDQFRVLRNCPPTPPLRHYFALSEK